MKKLNGKALLPLITLCLVACGGKTDETAKPDTTPVTEQTTERPAPVEDDKVHIIVLAGQSGARGKALNTDLSEEDSEENAEVDIMADGLTMPSLSNIPENPTVSGLKAVAPGLGDSGNEFGPEIGMAKQMASRYQKSGKSHKSVIVKYTACGSTFTADWYSKSTVDDDELSAKLDQKQVREYGDGNFCGPLTSNLYKLLDATTEALTDEGYEYVIDGAVFCHGEQDAKFETNMSIYKKALENFVKDFRSYVGDEDLPFVITEAGTNAARYSNKLREIQKEVSDADKDIYFVNTDDLYTNTFEPWHFGADSNIVLGERMAEELIHLNDNRKVTSFVVDPIHVPLKSDISVLPEYLTAQFSNETTGIVKVTYPDGLDALSLGDKKVKVKAETNWGEYTAEIDVTVDNAPHVDGKTKEWTTKLNKVNDKVSVGFYKAEEGLYVRAEVTDTELWTDGEAWKSGDMGQMKNNDDLRLFLTESDESSRIPIFLSDDNLLRIYDAGTTSYTPASNGVYSKFITSAQSHVITTGEVNVPGGGEGCTGMTMELYIPYTELGIEDADSLKVLVAYSDISKADENTKRTEEISYLASGSVTGTDLEKNINAYYSLSDLI